MMAQKRVQAQEECYISVDIEASGPVPGIYSMLSLGACLVSATAHTFYAELRPITEHAVPEALRVSGFTLDQLAHTGRDPQEAMEAFRKWVLEASTGMIPVF